MLQNASFTLVSRARNSSSIKFHAIAAVCSNGMYILVFRNLVMKMNEWPLMVTYVVGTVIGSIAMHKISMKYFEKGKAKVS